MPRKRSSRNPLPAGLGWWQPAQQLWEIAIAAPQVIAARSALLASPGSVHRMSDRIEFARMGWEKIHALNESLTAASLELWNVNQRTAMAGAQQWWNGWLRLAAGARPWPVMFAPGRLPMPRVPVPTSLSGLPRLTAKTLAPVHRRVTKNAKRLAPKRGRKAPRRRNSP